MSMGVFAEDLLGGSVPALLAEEAQRAALMYISMGWAVTAGPGIDSAGVCACNLKGRCRNPGKHAYKGWGNEERRTLTAEQAELYWSPRNALWKDKPVDQVFIVPYLSGLAVADVDDMDAWLALEESKQETLHQKSGSGRGGHFLYGYEWDLEDPTPPLLPGKLPGGAGELKFRGIIVAAPSVHPSGGRYAWDNWGTEICPVPESLLTRHEVVGDRVLGWDTIVDAGPFEDADKWMKYMFFADCASLKTAGDADSARPLVLFAVAAGMAKWIAAGWITEDEVVERLMEAADRNGALDKYGRVDIERQIRNGIRSGIVEKRE